VFVILLFLTASKYLRDMVEAKKTSLKTLRFYLLLALPKSSLASGLSQLPFSSAFTLSNSALTLPLFFFLVCSCNLNVSWNFSIMNGGNGDFLAVL